ncbi:MAG: hypothetical protein EPN76_14915 [Burkholderiaceae bacterium]|nr:MAG: hypothetical protein EPN76_14915 [Burkholderiaceae bacterium]
MRNTSPVTIDKPIIRFITKKNRSALPKIYVISLAAAQERRAFMYRQLQPLGVPYEIFNAIHGKQNPHFHLFKKYNEKNALAGVAQTPR